MHAEKKEGFSEARERKAKLMPPMDASESFAL